MEIIGVIIAGIIIGLLGKFVAPGDKDNIPIWLTIVCGIGGVILGWYVYAAFGGNGSSGVDWVRWVVAILVAAVLVVIASNVTGRNSGRRSNAL
ncbi:transglycosylase [soil metagenome]